MGRGKLAAVRGSRRVRGSARCAIASALLVAGCAKVAGTAREPRSLEVGPQEAATAAERASASCRSEVAAALGAGEQREGRCSAEGERIAGQLLAAGPRRSFGMRERQTVGLSGVSLVLSEAYGCRRWPLRAPGRTGLDMGSAHAAGCKVRRYEGPLTISVIAEGGEVVPVSTVRADVDGQAEVVFTELDALLRARGRGGLFAFATLAVGAQGWAARLDLRDLRAQLAGWHATWVGRGRGAPGLFVALHPQESATGTLRVRALEATLRRQADDVAAVERGELSPRRFLERHTWSPYRSKVEQIEEARR